MTVSTFKIPVPPSVNAMHANRKGAGRGRVNTKEYRAWRKAAGQEMLVQRVPFFRVPVRVEILIPDSINGDIDNRIKPTLDALVNAGRIEDDGKKHVRGVSCAWWDGQSGEYAQITVRPA